MTGRNVGRYETLELFCRARRSGLSAPSELVTVGKAAALRDGMGHLKYGLSHEDEPAFSPSGWISAGVQCLRFATE